MPGQSKKELSGLSEIRLLVIGKRVWTEKTLRIHKAGE
jgi:hypothetical protein